MPQRFWRTSECFSKLLAGSGSNTDPKTKNCVHTCDKWPFWSFMWLICDVACISILANLIVSIFLHIGVRCTHVWHVTISIWLLDWFGMSLFHHYFLVTIYQWISREVWFSQDWVYQEYIPQNLSIFWCVEIFGWLYQFDEYLFQTFIILNWILFDITHMCVYEVTWC